jgi:hypothetical protein
MPLKNRNKHFINWFQFPQTLTNIFSQLKMFFTIPLQNASELKATASRYTDLSKSELVLLIGLSLAAFLIITFPFPASTRIVLLVVLALLFLISCVALASLSFLLSLEKKVPA